MTGTARARHISSLLVFGPRHRSVELGEIHECVDRRPFTTPALAMFVHRNSDGLDQFNAVMGAVRASPHLVALGKDGRGEDRFTSREMIETERRLEEMTGLLAL